MPRTDGVDFTKYQGAVNWSEVEPYEFLTVRATESFPSGRVEIDSQYSANRAGLDAHPARWKFLYHFVSQRDPIEQLDAFRNVVGNHLDVGYGTKLDIETDPGAGIGTLSVDHLLTVLDAFTQHYQRPMVAYIGHYYPGQSAIRGRYPIDLPWYVSRFHDNTPPVSYPLAAWQWTSDLASTLGISGLSSGMRITAQQIEDRNQLDTATGRDFIPGEEDMTPQECNDVVEAKLIEWFGPPTPKDVPEFNDPYGHTMWGPWPVMYLWHYMQALNEKVDKLVASQSAGVASHTHDVKGTAS